MANTSTDYLDYTVRQDIEGATVILMTRHNCEVWGRQLCRILAREPWNPSWSVDVVRMIQLPGLLGLPVPNIARIQAARAHAQSVFKACESPLEEVFLASVIGISCDLDFFSTLGCVEPCIGAWPRSGVEIFQQFQIASHRVDFMFKHDSGSSYVVELDGHSYHSTREDLARDKSRDRQLQEAGFRVLRFTYDEMWPDPVKCVHELHRIVTGREISGAAQ